MLEDKRNNTVYTIVAFRPLTYDEMIAFGSTILPHMASAKANVAKKHRITICTKIGLED